MSIVLPDLAQRIAWYQEHLRPDDPAMGNGIADWTITAEYVPALKLEGKDVWGLMCSPAGLPEALALTPEDIAAKRAHIVIRTPSNAAELAEVERTLLHECGHVLVAPMQSANTAAEENAMHSLDALFSKISPEARHALARAMQNPKAREYSATHGDNMADNNNSGGGGEKAPPEGEKAKASEGAPRDVAAIQADIVKAVLAGQPTEDLAKELVAAQALAGAAAAPLAEASPPPPPTMGMQQQDPYAREKAAIRDGIEAVIDGRPDLSEPQRAQVRKAGTVAAARELAGTYPRPAPEPAKPTMGLPGHPSTPAGGGKKETALARAISEAQGDDIFRRAMGIGSAKDDGIRYDVPGHIIYIDGSERLRHQREAYRNRRAAQ